jgi:hypothetical protein
MGVEAVHLEEPEFWARAGYSEGFKREWQAHYDEPWQPPHSSVDAQWRASKLKYHLYRRALQQVFDHVREFNRRTGGKVRCYVPTHSLINYATELKVVRERVLAPGVRCFLLDLDAVRPGAPRVLAAACKTLPKETADGTAAWTVEGVGGTPAIVLIAAPTPPRAVTLDGAVLTDFTHSADDGLLRVRFSNESRPRVLAVEFRH